MIDAPKLVWGAKDWLTIAGPLAALLLVLLPAAVAIAVNPVPIIAALVMPATRRPRACGVAYICALVGVMAGVGVVVLGLFQGLASAGGGTSHEVFEWIRLAIGVGFLVAFTVILVRRPAPGHESDEPSWMRRIGGGTRASNPRRGIRTTSGPCNPCPFASAAPAGTSRAQTSAPMRRISSGCTPLSSGSTT